MLDALYPWLKAAHIAAAVAFVSGLLAGAIVLAAVQSQRFPEPASASFMQAVRAWDRRVTTPAILLVWALGLTLALQGHWFRSVWLPAKLVIVLALSAWHGVQSGTLRRLAGGATVSPRREHAFVPLAIFFAVLAIVLLAVLKPR
jgi:protoporphyrinogen IX oxidase